MTRLTTKKVPCLFVLILLAWGCQKSSGGGSDAPVAEPDPYGGRERTLVFDGLRRGHQRHHMALDPVVIPLPVKDLSGLTVSYELTDCYLESRDKTEDWSRVSDGYCSAGLRFDSAGNLIVEAPQAIGYNFDNTGEFGHGRFHIGYKVSNGIPSDDIDTGIELRIINVAELDIRDEQFMPQELEGLPEHLRLPIVNSAMQSAPWYLDKNPAFGGGAIPLGSAWYLGSHAGRHYIVTARHAVTVGDKVRKFDYFFPYHGLTAYHRELVYDRKNLDFAIIEVEFDHPELAQGLKPTPIDVSYLPTKDDPLMLVGYSNMDVVLSYPGIALNQTCRVLSSEDMNYEDPDIKKGFPTGCKPDSADSGGLLAQRDTGKVTSIISVGTYATDPKWSLVTSTMEELIADGQYLGAIHVPFAWVRKAMIEDIPKIEPQHLRFLAYTFGFEERL